MNIIVEGPAYVYLTAMSNTDTSTVPTVSDDGVSLVGTTESGVQISIGGQVHRISTDDLGGSEGAPADILFMGVMASIRGVMVRTEAAGLKKMMAGMNKTETDGRYPGAGTAMFGDKHGFGLLIVGSNKRIWFPKTELVSTPREYNISSTERKTSFTANAYPIIYSAAVSASEAAGTTCHQLLYLEADGVPMCAAAATPASSGT